MGPSARYIYLFLACDWKTERRSEVFQSHASPVKKQAGKNCSYIFPFEVVHSSHLTFYSMISFYLKTQDIPALCPQWQVNLNIIHCRASSLT